MPTDAGDTFNTSEDSMTDDTTITDSERDLLRFPAIADVLRFGTPVRSNNPERTYKGQAVILSVDPGRQEARVAYAHSLVYPTEWVSLDDIALDLTDATGRAHLAWWMAHNVTRHQMRADVPTLAEAPMFGSYALRHSGDFILAGREHNSQRLWRWRGSRGVVTMVGELPVVPALATLDPDDPRLLPDGSRLVDALALSMVGRHLLAGGGR